MDQGNKNILSINGGSSSIKFSLYDIQGSLNRRLTGKIERIGRADAVLTFTDMLSGQQEQSGSAQEGRLGSGLEGRLGSGQRGQLPVRAPGMREAADFLLDWLRQREGGMQLSAVGHRIVHGLGHREPAIIDENLLAELQRISGYDPDHLPGEIELVRLFGRHDPALRQVACFDTAFHASLPRVARLLPLPRRYDQAGLQRYGFHGLSYSYILGELTRIAGPAVAGGSVIMAHLGSGASLAAVKGGYSIDTTMGFTPTGGIVMGTRTGDLDPGAAWWILQKEGLTASQFSDLVNHQSGLLGVSGISSDMQELLARESSDVAAAEAVALFCYQVKKSIGAFSAALGGLDALVFTGGIGEKSSMIRSRICAGLDYLGIGLEQRANEKNELLISAAGSRAGVYAIPTDEEIMIARETIKLLNV
jgi:acetate kinase